MRELLEYTKLLKDRVNSRNNLSQLNVRNDYLTNPFAKRKNIVMVWVEK